MTIRPEVLAAPAYHFSAKDAAIKLDQNESAYDLDDALKAEVLERLKAVAFNRYPELSAHSLATRLAKHEKWSPEGIVLSGGSNVLIQALILAAGLGKTVLTVKPSFSVYSLQAQLLGVNLSEIALDESFELNMPKLLAALESGAGVFFLANPAAPTGNTFSRADIEHLAEASKDAWLMVIDEAYYQFANTNYLELVSRFNHVVCLRTFSKAFGLGGVRLGYALMQASLAENVQKLILPFSVSALQQSVGMTVLEHTELVQERTQEVLEERSRVVNELSRLPTLTVYPSETNFILFRVPDAESFYEGLLDKGVLIRRQDHLYGLEGCLRVSIGKPDENTAFLDAARTLIGELSYG